MNAEQGSTADGDRDMPGTVSQAPLSFPMLAEGTSQQGHKWSLHVQDLPCPHLAEAQSTRSVAKVQQQLKARKHCPCLISRPRG